MNAEQGNIKLIDSFSTHVCQKLSKVENEIKFMASNGSVLKLTDHFKLLWSVWVNWSSLYDIERLVISSVQRTT